MWFEQRPGSEETLHVLYEAVQAAEELDLEEQIRTEEVWAQVPVWDDGHVDPAETDPAAVEESDADEDDRISMSQAVGIVEHLLGGHPMAAGDQSAS
jgi:hypothetical protein